MTATCSPHMTCALPDWGHDLGEPIRRECVVATYPIGYHGEGVYQFEELENLEEDLSWQNLWGIESAEAKVRTKLADVLSDWSRINRDSVDNVIRLDDIPRVSTRLVEQDHKWGVFVLRSGEFFNDMVQFNSTSDPRLLQFMDKQVLPLSTETKRVADNTEALLKALIFAFNNGPSLVTASYVAKKMDCDESVVKDILDTSSKIRKSLIKSSNGEDVYRLNTEFSFIVDLWEAFRHICARKI